MNTLIVYKSYHRMNTEKVAKAMAEAMNAQLTKVEDVRPEALAGYDLIGFGSGIYGLKHHKALIDLIEAMPAMDKNVFVFSTCGNVREVNHQAHQGEAYRERLSHRRRVHLLWRVRGRAAIEQRLERGARIYWR